MATVFCILSSAFSTLFHSISFFFKLCELKFLLKKDDRIPFGIIIEPKRSFQVPIPKFNKIPSQVSYSMTFEMSTIIFHFRRINRFIAFGEINKLVKTVCRNFTQNQLRMLLVAGPTPEFLKFIQVLCWIILPVLVLCCADDGFFALSEKKREIAGE